MSRYDADDVYCILGTAVLKNKAGITDQELLDEFEADFTAIRILEMTQNPVEGSFDLAHLCKIHQYLFQDVYEWAGEVRSVDIIRGDSRFCNVRQIQSYSNTIFSALASEKYLVNLEPKVFSHRLVHYLSEINTTRARQGMVIAVPHGDTTDPTRETGTYDEIYAYLRKCGLGGPVL